MPSSELDLRFLGLSEYIQLSAKEEHEIILTKIQNLLEEVLCFITSKRFSILHFVLRDALKGCSFEVEHLLDCSIAGDVSGCSATPQEQETVAATYSERIAEEDDVTPTYDQRQSLETPRKRGRPLRDSKKCVALKTNVDNTPLDSVTKKRARRKKQLSISKVLKINDTHPKERTSRRINTRRESKIAQSYESNDDQYEVINNKDNVGYDEQVSQDDVVDNEQITDSENQLVEECAAEGSNKLIDDTDVNKDGENCYFCYICDNRGNNGVMLSKDDFLKHMLEEHMVKTEDGKLSLTCDICNKLFSLRHRQGHSMFRELLGILNHMVGQHGFTVPGFVETFSCPKCPFTSVMPYIHKRHLDRHHRDPGAPEENVRCDDCGRTMRVESLNTHRLRCPTRRIDHSEQSTIKCEHCDKTFSSKMATKLHVDRTHSHISEFLCSHCPASFFAKADLERHMFSKHDINISRQAVEACTICGFKSLQGSMMRKHMRNHQVGTFPCLVCNKVFATKNRLASHRANHNAEKKYRCTLCEYQAKKKYHIDRHIAKKHNGLRWRCGVCSFTTYAATNLLTHYRKTHNMECPDEVLVPRVEEMMVQTKVAALEVMTSSHLSASDSTSQQMIMVSLGGGGGSMDGSLAMTTMPPLPSSLPHSIVQSQQAQHQQQDVVDNGVLIPPVNQHHQQHGLHNPLPPQINPLPPQINTLPMGITDNIVQHNVMNCADANNLYKQYLCSDHPLS